MSNEERRKLFKKISAEVPMKLFEKMDNKAREQKINKSELIRKALKQYISA